MITYAEFIRQHPSCRHIPEFITGAQDQRVRLLDATYADLCAYRRLLERRIARRRRSLKRTGGAW